MERVAPPLSTHNIHVTHDGVPSVKETAEILSRIDALAAKFSVRLPAPTIIEGEVIEAAE